MERGIHPNKKRFANRKAWSFKIKTEEEETVADEDTKDSHMYACGTVHDKFSPQEVSEPDYEEDNVILSWYDSDLNLIIDEKNFTAASPLHERGFCYLQAGARATYGFFSGKVCFEVKLLNCCELLYMEGHLNAYLMRVGWSPRKASLALGSDHKSYGYDSTGRASTIGEIMDYGETFSTGDVVCAYMDLTGDAVIISYTLNGVDQGVAYEVPQTEIQKEPLFPHVLTKNISYECHFGGEEPWFPLKEGYTFVGDVPTGERIAGPKRPKSKSDCEVIMMCGLPKSGKTTWINDLRERNPGMYYVIDTAALIDRMEAKDPDRKAILLRKTRVMGRLLAIAMDRRRNYILDQINVVRSEQLWKLGLFKYFMRRIVVVVIPDAELQRRVEEANDRPPGDLSWLLQLKAKFVLPTQGCPHIANVADKVDFVELPEEEALQLVKQYNHEAWRLGYKPHKNFVIPGYVFKEKQKKGPGSWKERATGPAFRNTDPPGSSRWSSPTKNRNNEKWLAHREKMSGDRQSPPRKRSNEEWHSSPGNRGGSGTRSPFRNRDENEWRHQNRSRGDWESPSRNRPNDRWGHQQDRSLNDTQAPPRSRFEDWQSRNTRPLDRRTSPPRRTPDGDERYGGSHSPPRNRMDDGRLLPDTSRPDFQFQDDRNRVRSDRFGTSQLHQADRIGDSWSSREGRIGNVFPSHERNMSNIHLHHDQIGGNMPQVEHRFSGNIQLHEGRATGQFPSQENRMNEVFPLGERILSGNFHPQDGRQSRDFSPGDGRLGSGFSGPSDRMERNIQEGRLSVDLPLREERIGAIVHHRDGNMNTDFAPHDNRIVGGFPPQEGRVRSDFHHQEDRSDGNFLLVDRRIDVGFPTPDNKMNDRLPLRIERMSSDLQQQEARFGNFPLHEGRHVGDFFSLEGKSGSDMPSRGRVRDDFSPHRGNIGGNLPPHGGRMGNFPPLEGRIGSNIIHLQDRMGDRPPHNERMVRDLSPCDHRMSGDMPPHEGRTNNFPLHEGRVSNDMPFRGNRMDGDLPTHLGQTETLPPHDGRMGGGDLHGGRNDSDMQLHGGRVDDSSPHGGRMSGDLPPHGLRMGGDFPPHGLRMGGDLPLHGGNMGGDMPPHGGRMGSDMLPHGGRMGSDMLPHGGRMGGDMPPHGGRMGGDMPPHGGRMGSDMPPHGGRMGGDMPPHGGRMGGDMPPHGGRMGGDIPPLGGRMGGDMPPHGGRTGDLPPRGGRIDADLPSHEIRIGGDQPHDGRTRSTDLWNRLAPKNEHPTNFIPSNRQEWPDERQMRLNEERFDSSREGGSNHPDSSTWPKDRRDLQRTQWDSPQSDTQHRIFNTELLNNQEHGQGPSFRFQEDSASLNSRSGSAGRVSEARAKGGWEPEVNRPGGGWQIQDDVRSRGHQPDRMAPPGNTQENQQFVQHRGGNRERDNSGTHFHENRDGGGRSSDWQSHEDRNRGTSSERRGPSDRLPQNRGRDHHSPPRKHPRLETRKLVGPGVLFPDGADDRNEHNMSDWKSPEQVLGGRNPNESSGNHGRVLPGSDSRVDMGVCGPSFGAQRPDVGPANQGDLFPPVGDGVMNEPGAGKWQTPGDRRRPDWQSPAGSRVSRWERVPQKMEGLNPENDELAPYEQPFNQAVWDSNEPDAGVLQGDGNDPSRRGNLPRMEDRSRGSSDGRRLEVGPQPGNRPRGSVWQRVGGYVDDDDKDRSSRDLPPRSRFSNRSPSGGRGEKSHRNTEVKEKGRNFDENRSRRGRANSSDKPESTGRKRVSPHRSDRNYPKESSRDQWKSPLKKHGGHWR